jgi:predicted SnoaL-like aldol condensation-catalyzing enzyme
MHVNEQTRDDFIPYPTNRVVGTIAAAGDARAALDSLLRAGFQYSDIDILHGEKDLHRLDPTGAEHGFWARFQRTLIRTAGPAEEFRHLSRHVEDVRAGRFVIMVLSTEREKRDVAAGILSSHGAEYVGFYGRWAFESMDAARVDALHAVTGLADADQAIVTAFYDLMFNRADLGERGPRGATEYASLMACESPGTRVEFQRLLADGDCLVLHCHAQWPGDGDLAGIEVFRLDANGKIAEHWDVLQRVPAGARATAMCGQGWQ